MAGRSLRKARKRQRKALRQARRQNRKEMKVTNRMYRKSTRVERGTDFASKNNSKIGDMLVGVVDTAANAVASYLAPQTAMPDGMAGTHLIYMGSTADAEEAALDAEELDDELDELEDEETEEEEAPAVPRWVVPAAIGGVVLLLAMRS